MSDETSAGPAQTGARQATRSSAESLASTWVGVSWLLLVVGGCVGFVVGGHLPFTSGVSVSDEDFDGVAGLAGMLLVVVFFLPWVGVMSVLRELTRSVDARSSQLGLPHLDSNQEPSD